MLGSLFGMTEEELLEYQKKTNKSLMELIRAHVPKETLEKALQDYSDEEIEILMSDWRIRARPKQMLPPGTWTYWLVLAGRGFGKTRTGVETVKQWIKQGHNNVNLIGATHDDAVKIMVDGESGILWNCTKDERPSYNKSSHMLTWPNGAVSEVLSADRPDRFRGRQHEKVWADELCAWRYPEAWTQIKMGMRLLGKDGSNLPQCIITTTPRPTEQLKAIVKLAEKGITHLTKGSTMENATNLAKEYIESMKNDYGNSRFGRQELEAEILDDNPGALWKRDQIDANRIFELVASDTDVELNPDTGKFEPVMVSAYEKLRPTLKEVVVSIDPAVSMNKESDETGLIVAGIDENGKGYVFEDASGKYLPQEWAAKALALVEKYDANYIVAEINNGGNMIENTIRQLDASVMFKSVHASQSKFSRAEPVAVLYEQNKISHVGCFNQLEDQMCSFDKDNNVKSPDRMDAMVWAFYALMVKKNKYQGLRDYVKAQAKLGMD